MATKTFYDANYSVSAALAYQRNSELEGAGVSVVDAATRAMIKLQSQGASLHKSRKRHDVITTALTSATRVQWTFQLCREGAIAQQCVQCELFAVSEATKIRFSHSRAVMWFPRTALINVESIDEHGWWTLRNNNGDSFHGAYDLASMQIAEIYPARPAIYSIAMNNVALQSKFMKKRLGMSRLLLVVTPNSVVGKWKLHCVGIELNVAPTLSDIVCATLGIGDQLDTQTCITMQSRIGAGVCSAVFTSERQKQDVAGMLAPVIRKAFALGDSDALANPVEAAVSFSADTDVVEFYVDTQGVGKLGVPVRDENDARATWPVLVDIAYADMLHEFVRKHDAELRAEIARLSGGDATLFNQRDGPYTSVCGYEALYNLCRKTRNAALPAALRACYARVNMRTPTLGEMMSGTSGLPIWLTRKSRAIYADLMNDTLGDALANIEKPERSVERAQFERTLADALTHTIPIFAPNTGFQQSALALSLLQLVVEFSSAAVQEHVRNSLRMPTAVMRGSLLGEALQYAFTGRDGVTIQRGDPLAHNNLCSIEAPLHEVCAALRVLRSRPALTPVFVERSATGRLYVDAALRRETATANDIAMRIEASGPNTETVFLHVSSLVDAQTSRSPRALDHYTYALSTSDDAYVTLLLTDSVSGGVFALRTLRTPSAINGLTIKLVDGIVRQLVRSAQVTSVEIASDPSFLLLDMVTRHAIDVAAREGSASSTPLANNSQRAALVRQNLIALRAMIDKHFVGVEFVPPFGNRIGEISSQSVKWLTGREETATAADGKPIVPVLLEVTVRQNDNATSTVLTAVFDHTYGDCGAFRLSDDGEAELRNPLDFDVVKQRMITKPDAPVIDVPLMSTLGCLTVPALLVADLVAEQSARISQTRTTVASSKQDAKDITIPIKNDPYGDFSRRADNAYGTEVSPLLLSATSLRAKLLRSEHLHSVAGSPMHIENHADEFIDAQGDIVKVKRPSLRDRTKAAMYGLLHPPAFYYDEFGVDPALVYGPVVYSLPYYTNAYGRRLEWNERKQASVVGQLPVGDGSGRGGNVPL